MSEFSDLFHSISKKAAGLFVSARSDISTETSALIAKIQQDISPEAYAILKASVLTAEVTGGAWQVKLFAAVTGATAQFTAKGLPIVLNDIVAAIAAIVGELNAEKAKIAA